MRTLKYFPIRVKAMTYHNGCLSDKKYEMYDMQQDIQGWQILLSCANTLLLIPYIKISSEGYLPVLVACRLVIAEAAPSFSSCTVESEDSESQLLRLKEHHLKNRIKTQICITILPNISQYKVITSMKTLMLLDYHKVPFTTTQKAYLLYLGESSIIRTFIIQMSGF